ncbi:MAG: hypothetical protein Q7S36_03380 [Candidatus Liptonbacteria bacterium]|nr:hypothetical protein [Candidatus Liptonbacteria bacterium]
MTFIRKEKENNINLLLLLLAVPLIFGIISIIAVYNQTINLKHGITDMKVEMRKIESESAGLNDRLFGIFDPKKVEEFAKERGLVKEAKPSYLEVTPWALASHF